MKPTPKIVSPYTEIARLKRLVQLLYARICYYEDIMPVEQATMMRTVVDAAAMANNDIFRMSIGRVVKWEDTVNAYLTELDKEGMSEANSRVYRGKYIVDGDDTLPATREKIDRRLREIYGPAFKPFDVRYNWALNQQIFEKYKGATEALQAEMPYLKSILGGR